MTIGFLNCACRQCLLCAILLLALSSCTFAQVSPTPVSTTSGLNDLVFPTPSPTADYASDEATLLSFFNTDTGCRLPCWWGIDPGRTTWEEAENIMKPLSSQLTVWPDSEQMQLKIVHPPGQITSEYLSIEFYAHNRVIRKIEISGVDRVTRYSLPVILTEQGSPTEIWIRTFSSFFTTEETPFEIYILYRQRGILAQYDTDSAKFDGDLIRACAADLTNIRVLRLWDPQLNMSMSDAMKSFDFSSGDGSLLLSTDSLGLDASAFTKAYAGVDQPCFTTPRKKWLGIDGLPYHP